MPAVPNEMPTDAGGLDGVLAGVVEPNPAKPKDGGFDGVACGVVLAALAKEKPPVAGAAVGVTLGAEEAKENPPAGGAIKGFALAVDPPEEKEKPPEVGAACSNLAVGADVADANEKAGLAAGAGGAGLAAGDAALASGMNGELAEVPLEASFGSSPQLKELLAGVDVGAPGLSDGLRSATALLCARDDCCRDAEPREPPAAGDVELAPPVEAAGVAKLKEGAAFRASGGGVAASAGPARLKEGDAPLVPLGSAKDGVVEAELPREKGAAGDGGARGEGESVAGAPGARGSGPLALAGPAKLTPLGAAPKRERAAALPSDSPTGVAGVAGAAAGDSGKGDLGAARIGEGARGGGDGSRGGGGGVQRLGRGRRSPVTGPRAKAICRSEDALNGSLGFFAVQTVRLTSGSVARRPSIARFSTLVERSADSAALATVAASALAASSALTAGDDWRTAIDSFSDSSRLSEGARWAVLLRGVEESFGCSRMSSRRFEISSSS